MMPSSTEKPDCARERTSHSVHCVAEYAIALALALVISYIENLVVPQVFVGVKLGLANTLIMYLFFTGKRGGAVCVQLLRVLVMSLLFGNASSFLFSLFGALLSLASLYMSLLLGERISLIGAGVMSCAMHGAGQVIAAMIFYSSVGLIYYLPWLLIWSVPMGAVSGILTTLIARGVRYR